MSQIQRHPEAMPEETTWEGSGDYVILQRDCDADGCDRGLLLYPARFCGKCHGSGYLTRTVPFAEADQ